MTAQEQQLAADEGALRWYLVVVAAWFIPQGMHQVLITWMVRKHLMLGAAEVGLAQTTLKLPALFLVLFGGLVAERLDGRRILILLFALGSLPAVGLAFLDLGGHISFPWVILYTLAIGIIVAFMIPARETLVERVAGSNIQRTVTAATGIQFGVQLVGFTLAGMADSTGIAPLFFFLALVLFCGSFASRRLPPAPEKRSGSVGGEGMKGVTFMSALRDIGAGLELVWKSPVFFPVVLLNLFIGIFYMGTLFVLVPEIIVAQHNGGSREIALMSAAFMIGTILSVVFLLRRGGIRRRGAAMIFAVSAGAILMAVLTIPMPLYALGILHFFWGAGAGIVLSMGRTIVQGKESGPFRARVLSIFSLGFQGGAPMGALAMGYVTEFMGPFRAAAIPAAGMSLIVAYIMLRTRLFDDE